MKVQKNKSLKKLNTLGISSVAKTFITIQKPEELNDLEEDVFILGGGSNICLGSKIEKPVVKIDIKGIKREGNLLVVGAGEEWDSFVKKTTDVPFIENLSGIPGTVGASPIQNIGAYGVEAKDIIKWVEVFDLFERELKKLDNKECDFKYRDSIFKRKKNYIVTRVAFKISKSLRTNLEYKDLAEYFKSKKPTKTEVRKAVLKIRAGKFPDMKRFGTAGSFFQNPVVSNKEYKSLKKRFPEVPSYNLEGGKKKIPLAWVLDKVCNLKGYRKGNVWLHESQPLVLVTNKLATGKEIKKFSEEIKKIVFQKTKLKIKNEVIHIYL